MFECYSNIIGITQADCGCIAEGRPADYDESRSGLYLDELAEVATLVNLGDCEKSVWDMMGEAIASATKLFIADTNALLGKRFRLKRKAVSGQVLGQIKHKDTYAPSKNYAQVTLSCAPVRGGYMTLKKLGGVFTQAGEVLVELSNSLGASIGTYTLTTIPNKHVEVSVGIELPLHSKYLQPLEYFLTYQFDMNNLPKATQLDCGCDGWEPVFNKEAPYYQSVGAHKRARWANYVMLGGREINSLAELEDEKMNLSNDMFGLSLEVDFACKVSEVLCEEALDFTGNPLALSMALAVKYATGVKLASKVLRSSKLNRENMINTEDWELSALEWQEKYNEHVNYIVSQADYTTNDCLACKDVIGLTRRGLFS